MIPAIVTIAIYYAQGIQRGVPLEWQQFAAIVTDAGIFARDPPNQFFCVAVVGASRR
jgi:hypothetical protein